MPDETCNVALVGTKFMGRAHSNAYLNVAKFFDLPVTPVMHTVVARNEKETKDFAERWGWRNSSTDWQAAVADAEIDLVDIVTPNNVHAEHAIAALEAGKHVACEKPLANTLDAARQMVEAAKEAKGKTFVWYNYRRCPAVAFAHQICQQGKLGRIYQIRGCYLQDWAGPDTPLMWRFDGEVAGSGSLGDLCAHTIDTARFITGDEVSEVVGATMETVIKERPILESSGGEISGRGAETSERKGASTVDDIVLFVARMESGALATFEATRLSTGYKNANRLEIHGEKGAVRFNFERMNELDWYDATAPEELQGWSTINVTNGNANHPYAGAWWPVAHVLGYEHSFINQTADILNVLGGKAAVVPLPDFADAYEVQRVLAAVVQSDSHRCPISLCEVN
ncbi:MAG: Gfo/Idh/MocA family oxidoreductase [Pirellulaceae bacterium]|jgi:predicted dehydrogenase|nr:Gfo/Idh/MocA family oxidoreductase [Pirellulaceae bacterium]HJN10441.1 Gfo/Idh/MocA family oxidoreductase [Pirellulaceae bacterium]